MADQTLDAKGLNCPLPILKAKKALTGHELIEQSVEGNVYRFVLRRKA
jgi:TusA-related sulfurtransferase